MKRIISFCLLLLVSMSAMSQDAQKALTADQMTWFGIDYSHVKLIGSFSQFGDAGVLDEDDIRKKYFPAWNNIIVKEESKYDLKGAFRKNEVNYKLAMLEKINAATSNASMVSIEESDRNHLNVEKITSIVAKYPLAKESGIGLVFIAESLDKNIEEGNYYVTFFDIATKKVLMVKRMTGKAGGFGVRNYWARSFYNVLVQSKKDYKKWLKESK
jgi:hypothetical protein